MRLEGKTALVTGGASGIGAATARRLAAEGARVAIGDINEDGAKAVAGELDGFGCALDVTDTGSVRAGVAAIEDALGAIDVLVNNAGTDRFSFFVNSDEELVGLRARRQPARRARGHARGAAGDAGAQDGRDRERRQRGRPRRLAGLGRVLGREGRRDRLHEGDRPRVGALPRALQRGRAGADRDAAVRLRAAGAWARSASVCSGAWSTRP